MLQLLYACVNVVLQATRTLTSAVVCMYVRGVAGDKDPDFSCMQVCTWCVAKDKDPDFSCCMHVCTYCCRRQGPLLQLLYACVYMVLQATRTRTSAVCMCVCGVLQETRTLISAVVCMCVCGVAGDKDPDFIC